MIPFSQICSYIFQHILHRLPLFAYQDNRPTTTHTPLTATTFDLSRLDIHSATTCLVASKAHHLNLLEVDRLDKHDGSDDRDRTHGAKLDKDGLEGLDVGEADCVSQLR